MAYEVIVIILTVVLAYFVHRKQSVVKGKSLPGPSGLPWIGCAMQFGFSNLHLKLTEWRIKYGDIYQYKIFGKNIIVVSSSNVARELFQKEPNATISANRPQSFTNRIVCNDEPGVIFSPHFDEGFKRRRKLTFSILRAYGKGMSKIENRIVQQLKRVDSEIEGLTERAIDPAVLVEDFILGTIENVLIGTSSNKKSEVHEFMRNFDHASNVVTDLANDAFHNLFPFLIYTGSPVAQAFHETVDHRRRLLGLFEKMLNAQEIENDAMYPALKDIISKDTAEWINWEKATTIMTDIIGAGFETPVDRKQKNFGRALEKGFLTTRGTLLSMIRILLSRPDVYSKMREEIRRTIGQNRCPSIADRTKLHYTESFILETLRYISHVPVVFRETSEEIYIDGYRLPPFSTVVMNLWDLHHSEKEWIEPLSFLPERFLDVDGQLLAATHPLRKKLLVFGIGKRSCIGESFARSRIFLFIVNLVSKFSIQHPEGRVPEMFSPLEMSAGLTLQPPKYQCIFRKIPNKNQ